MRAKRATRFRFDDCTLAFVCELFDFGVEFGDGLLSCSDADAPSRLSRRLRIREESYAFSCCQRAVLLPINKGSSKFKGVCRWGSVCVLLCPIATCLLLCRRLHLTHAFFCTPAFLDGLVQALTNACYMRGSKGKDVLGERERERERERESEREREKERERE